MKKFFSIMLAVLFSVGLIAAEERATRIIPIKNGNVNQIHNTLHILLGGTGVMASSDGEHIILSGPKDLVAGFEEIVKQLDVAKKDVETTVYMIVAYPQPGNAAPLPA